MRIMEFNDWPVSTRLAAVALAAALALDVVAVVRITQRGGSINALPMKFERTPPIVVRSPGDEGMVRIAANRTPFDAGPPVAAAATVAVPSPVLEIAPAQPRLVGTVVQGRDSGFVVVDLPDGGMRVVRVGERAGDLRLRSVRAGEATFDGPRGKSVLLKAQQAPEGRP